MATTATHIPPEVWEKIRELEEELQEGKHAAQWTPSGLGTFGAKARNLVAGGWRSRVDWAWVKILVQLAV